MLLQATSIPAPLNAWQFPLFSTKGINTKIATDQTDNIGDNDMPVDHQFVQPTPLVGPVPLDANYALHVRQRSGTGIPRSNPLFPDSSHFANPANDPSQVTSPLRGNGMGQHGASWSALGLPGLAVPPAVGTPLRGGMANWAKFPISTVPRPTISTGLISGEGLVTPISAAVHSPTHLRGHGPVGRYQSFGSFGDLSKGQSTFASGKAMGTSGEETMSGQ